MATTVALSVPSPPLAAALKRYPNSAREPRVIVAPAAVILLGGGKPRPTTGQVWPR